MKRLASCLALAAALASVPLAGCGVAGGTPESTSYGGDGGGDAGGGDGGVTSAIGKRAGGSGTQTPADETVADPGQEGSDPACIGGAPQRAYYMSADDSNSMASPAIAREWLTAKQAPPAAGIRTYEFLNYYNAPYDIPAMADGLGVHAELEMLPDSATDKVMRLRLQVGVQAFQVPRVPLVITYVVDTSGSLVGTGIERERSAILAIGDHLQAGDVLNVVTWSTKENVLLEGYVAHGDSSDQTALAKAVSALLPGGGSDLHAGLTKAYELAEAHFSAASLNRVVLLSDGGANLGVIDHDAIKAAAAKAEADGIYLVGVGIGPATAYTDDLMNLVTDAGRGAYVYLDSPDEATKLFDDRFDEIMNVAARAVQVEVDLPDYLEVDHFYGEAYAEDPEAIDPQNLAPGDSMVFNETLYVTNRPAFCGADQIAVRVKWETPIEHLKKVSVLPAVDIDTLLGTLPSPAMRKAEAVIAYAEALKKGTQEELAAAQEIVKSAAKDAPEDEDLVEILSLLSLHPALQN
ncbi:MAG: von Willebrand factor type A domain-containing protein [Polyangiaceae bacterium]